MSIKTFRQVIESGRFVAAAERLDMSTGMVSKHVMHIEKRLGVRLLNRNPPLRVACVQEILMPVLTEYPLRERTLYLVYAARKHLRQSFHVDRKLGVPRVEGASFEDLVALSKLLFLRGDLLGRIADHDRAEQVANEAIALSPDTARALYMRAQLAERLHHLEEAHALLDEALAADRVSARSRGEGVAMNRCWRTGMLLLWVALVLSGCAMVQVQSLDTREYIAMKRGDILTTGRLSEATRETVLVAGLSVSACAKAFIDCIETLSQSEETAADRRWAAQSELWLEQAMALPARRSTDDIDRRMAAWLETARYAYAYLFFSGRTAPQRAFEERQTQVRDYYNYAVQAAVAALFQRDASAASATRRHAGWTIHIDHVGVPLPEGVQAPKELIPASSLSFAGLRSTYRRDGFGAEFVAVMSDDPVTARQRARPYSEMPCPVVTVLFRFPGENAAQVLGTREAVLSAHDPYRDTDVVVRGQRVPLAANFTAGYGLWLAHAGFNRHSLRTLFGRAQDVERPHLYMMQPYDPRRRIIVMLHGLASSPEAWVNLANEVLGDETLREHFQVWQAYYPTNMPIAASQDAIRRAIAETLRHFDPDGRATASQDLVLIGHSMGGVLARLLVSSSGDGLWQWGQEQLRLDDEKLHRTRERLEPMLRFEPLAGVSRAIFIAAPHRGTDVANGRIARGIAKFVRVPQAIIKEFEEYRRTLGDAERGKADPALTRIPNSIDSLNAADPFVRLAATLPISSTVRYHSIIARKASLRLLDEQSDDGLVPYWSAHLDGAASEKVIVEGHRVQESAAAILEVRRILHQHIAEASIAETSSLRRELLASRAARP